MQAAAMSNDPSSDPIEEARALVKLRYRRARAARVAIQPAGPVFARIGRRDGGKRLPPLQTLQLRWAEIVGEALARYSFPQKLTSGKNGRILTLVVLTQAAPLVQHAAETIRERVSVAAGGDIVALRLIHGNPARPVSGGVPEARPRRPLTEAEAAEITALCAGIRDPGLRASIVALGHAVLSAK